MAQARVPVLVQAPASRRGELNEPNTNERDGLTTPHIRGIIELKKRIHE
jgi:hypothetical protein